MSTKELKLNDFLTTGEYPIYNGRVALHYFKLKRYTARQLEIRKHENIRYHLIFRTSNNYKLHQFKKAVNEPSGYCFETSLNKPLCKKCRITKTIGKPCYKIDEYHKLIQSNSFIGFATAHEEFCKKLKNHCWRKIWEEYSIDAPEKTILWPEETYHDPITGQDIPLPNEADMPNH